MKISTPVQFLCLILLGSAFLSGCRSRPASNSEKTAPARNEPRVLAIEKPDVQKITDEAVPSVNELVRTYNARNFGSPGWRQVSLELITDGNATKDFVVLNMWRNYENEVRTLFLLEEPTGLKGTSYLLSEKMEASPSMQVNLFFPAGERRVLDVGPENFGEGLLGSDFSYDDMRMLLPVQDWQYALTGRAMLQGELVWVIDAKPINGAGHPGSSWSLVRIYLARNFQLLLGADFHSAADAAKAIKQMRVQSYRQDNSVWTATRMVMAGPQNRFSVLTLREAHFMVADFDAQLFSPEQLPALSEKIQRGWTPAGK